MIRMTVLCPQCQQLFTRTIAGTQPHRPQGWYYPTAQADWCAECRLDTRWFPEAAQSA